MSDAAAGIAKGLSSEERRSLLVALRVQMASDAGQPVAYRPSGWAPRLFELKLVNHWVLPARDASPERVKELEAIVTPLGRAVASLLENPDV